jgi:hypothetical protein
MNFIQFIKDAWQQPYFGAVLAMLSCFCFYGLSNVEKPPKKIIVFIFYGVFAVSAALFLLKVVEIFLHPVVWDFTAFYLYGKVAAAGYNVYVPESFHTVFATMHDLPALDYAEFSQEVVNTGFLYPPQTILLFAPLGFLSYKAAILCWTIFTLLFVPGCIYQAYTQFFKPYKWTGLIFVTSLFFLLSPVRATVIFSQTNFILLFLLLLMYKYADKKYAGILLALAIFTKPYMIVFSLYFLWRKKWQALFYFTASVLIFTIATFLCFGKDIFVTYIFDNPSKRLPAWVFQEQINQSLHAVLLRAKVITIGTPFIYYCIVGAGLLLTGIFLFYLAKRKQYFFMWAVLLLSGLLLYPGTLSYYGTLLLFIVFRFFDTKEVFGFSPNINIVLIGVFYFLSSLSVFSCIWFLLCIVVYKVMQAAKIIKSPTP